MDIRYVVGAKDAEGKEIMEANFFTIAEAMKCFKTFMWMPSVDIVDNTTGEALMIASSGKIEHNVFAIEVETETPVCHSTADPTNVDKLTRFYFNDSRFYNLMCADEDWVVEYIKHNEPKYYDYSEEEIRSELRTSDCFCEWYECNVSNTIEQHFNHPDCGYRYAH